MNWQKKAAPEDLIDWLNGWYGVSFKILPSIKKETLALPFGKTRGLSSKAAN
jgi:hypothetical protein